MDKHRILEELQNRLEETANSEQDPAELLESVESQNLEQDLIQDFQINCTLQNRNHIDQSEAQFVESVLDQISDEADSEITDQEEALVELNLVEDMLIEIPKVQPVPTVRPVPSAQPIPKVNPNVLPVDSVPKVDPIPKVNPIPTVSPVPKVIPATETDNNNAVEQVAHSVPKVDPVPTVNPVPQAPRGKPVNTVKPVSTVNSTGKDKPATNQAKKPKGKSRFRTEPESTTPPSPAARASSSPPGKYRKSGTVRVATQRQYARRPASPINWPIAISIALSAIVLSVIGMMAYQNRGRDQSPKVAVKNSDKSVDSQKTSAPKNKNQSSNTKDSREEIKSIPSKNAGPFNPPVYAQILTSSNASWKRNPSRNLDDQQLSLVSGSVTIQMKNGADVVIVGPANFRLESSELLNLSSGRLSAVVPPKAVGFTVQTPASRVVDLGTVFDVSVNETGSTGVRVRKGEVEVEPLNSDGGKAKKWSLKKGDFKSIDRDGKSHDWNLTLKLDEQGRGTVHINGENFKLTDKTEFEAAKEQIFNEFKKFETEFLSRNAGSYSGIVDLAGSKLDFRSVSDFAEAKSKAEKQLKRLEDLLDKIEASDLLKDRVRATTDGLKKGKSSIARDGIEIDTGKLAGVGKGLPPGLRDSILRFDKNGITRGGRGKSKTNTVKPGTNELILNVYGAGGEFRLRTTDGKPVSDVRELTGASGETEINVSKDQKITLNLDGAGNNVYVPTSIRKNVRTTIQGAGNEVEYYTERTRFREKLRKEKEAAGKGTGAIPSTGKSIADDAEPYSRTSPKTSGRKKIGTALARDHVGAMMIVVSGQTNKVTLEITEANADAGIRTVHGIGETASIPVGAKQKVMIYLDGIRNEAMVPVEIKANVACRLDGIENRILYRTKDGKIVGGFEIKSRNQQNQYMETRKVSRGYVGGSPGLDKSTLLVLIEGEKQDVIFRKATRRGDYGAKFVQGKSNEVSYNVLPEQQVFVLNKARETIVFIDDELRESVTVETKGRKNAVDYFD